MDKNKGTDTHERLNKLLRLRTDTKATLAQIDALLETMRTPGTEKLIDALLADEGVSTDLSAGEPIVSVADIRAVARQRAEARNAAAENGGR